MTFEQLNSLPVWKEMPAIPLEEIAAVKLMNRVDTKYLVDERQCMRLFDAAAADYYVQVIGPYRACRYSTLYYDTPAWDMYHLHHNRRLTRQKIRTRTYVETGVSFLEIKDKTNKGRTRKHRMAIGADIFDTAATAPATAEFLQRGSRFAPAELTPSLATRFVRITLVNRAMTERLTIDFNLHFTNVRAAGGDGRSEGPGAANGTAALDGLVIIELKQDALAPSPMKRILGQMRIKPFKVSKYCIGEALTNPYVKHNRFKAKLRAIDKMSRNANKNNTL